MTHATRLTAPFLVTIAATLLVADEPQLAIGQMLQRVPPTEPAKAVETIQLQDGFRAELVAAEPLITDPIAMQYDENGLAYVVEMNDYPYSDKSHDEAWKEQTSEPIGRVSILEDTDGDRQFDKSTVFADKLSWPSGVAVWKGGVYVTCTPDVWYFKDTDGDRRADIRRKVFTGFRKYNVQAVMNNLQWGLDHRIYAAGSSNGGDIESVGHAASQPNKQAADATRKPTRIGRNDFRFDPRTEQFEAISGGARFGHTQDDWGNRFLCDIRNPIQHVVLSTHYLRRNPLLPVASALDNVAESGDAIAVYQISPPEAWRAINAQRLAANTATKSPYDSTVAKGFVTSSSGVTIYRGAAYPEQYYGNAFIGEVAGNLVMRYQLTPSGASFKGQRAHEQVEFLASTDNWFRPVNFVNAPDGTLHVLDMYRETIEHPWSMPDDLKAQADLTSGRDRGRIYRLVPPRYRAGFVRPPAPQLGKATIAELVAELENPNSWWRETAHRLLFERQDRNAVPTLRSLLREGISPLARLHALWSLEGLNALTSDDLQIAISDLDSHVREHAVRLAEPRMKDEPELLRLVIVAASDEDARVRFQAALTLGEVDDDRATVALVAIARRDAADAWTRLAVLSSLSRSTVPFLIDVLADRSFAESDAGRQMIGQLAFIVGAKNDQGDIDRVLQAADNTRRGSSTTSDRERWRVLRHVVMNLGAGLKRAGRNLSQMAADKKEPSGRLVGEVLDDARQTAMAADGDTEQRLEAISLLSYSSVDTVRALLTNLLDSRQPPAIQSAAIRAMTEFSGREVAEVLLDRHPTLTPDMQAELVDRLLTRTEWIPAVLDAVEAHNVPAKRISDTRRSLYMAHSNAAIRERAVKLFSGDVPGPRAAAIADYQPALSLPSDVGRGEKVFRRECINCHRLGTEGHEVGPNLATVQNRTPAQLLLNILDPTREVAPNFLEYVAVTNDGRIHSGIIASETATSITLRQAEAKQQIILRDDIDELRSSGKSLMPEGLEKKITPQEMTDVIAYVLSLK